MQGNIVKRTVVGGLLAGLVLAGLAWHSSGSRAMQENGNTRTTTGGSKTASGKQAILVELFTSEGCSSCPPADIFLEQLQKQQPFANVEIVALSEHVDYWNSLGWTDPFSSHDYTERQQKYSQSFHLDQVYTPQMVVNGQSEFLGSNRDQATIAIRHAVDQLRLPHASVQIVRSKIEPKSDTKDDTKTESKETKNSATPLTLQVRVEGVPALSAGDTAGVLLAITENNLSNNVREGENAGHTLPHIAVVRQLTVLGEAEAGHAFTATPSITLGVGWKHRDLSAVVFVQERGTRHILGVSRLVLFP